MKSPPSFGGGFFHGPRSLFSVCRFIKGFGFHDFKEFGRKKIF